jgi:hypothetical protein
MHKFAKWANSIICNGWRPRQDYAPDSNRLFAIHRGLMVVGFEEVSRRKKERKTHITLTDPDNPNKRVKVPYNEYPAARVF